ncbi:hypothetical protein [Sigmofec virus UA08Rod_5397]|uniref:Uncharacterized protein n=1 Tax=Sigmofec virus UA08Rod_5397 TaxID=2929423 RepID=A0A976N0V2_9VIRU|nr:hypothetical protein [Sigmofec virus UA08Rod_5397]
MDKYLTYRYFIRLKGEKDNEPDKSVFRVLTELPEGHQKFIEEVKHLYNLLAFGREYVCEYDSSKVGFFETIKEFKGVDNSEEV